MSEAHRAFTDDDRGYYRRANIGKLEEVIKEDKLHIEKIAVIGSGLATGFLSLALTFFANAKSFDENREERLKSLRAKAANAIDTRAVSEIRSQYTLPDDEIIEQMRSGKDEITLTDNKSAPFDQQKRTSKIEKKAQEDFDSGRFKYGTLPAYGFSAFSAISALFTGLAGFYGLKDLQKHQTQRTAYITEHPELDTENAPS